MVKHILEKKIIKLIIGTQIKSDYKLKENRQINGMEEVMKIQRIITVFKNLLNRVNI